MSSIMSAFTGEFSTFANWPHFQHTPLLEWSFFEGYLNFGVQAWHQAA